MQRKQVTGTEGRLFREYLDSDQGKVHHFQVDKPSSDCTPQFFSWAKNTFGAHISVQKDGNHVGRKCSIILFLIFETEPA